MLSGWAESYAGRRVVVTGCASGIGAAVARTLVGFGADVYAFDRRPPDFDVGTYVPVDLGDPRSIDAAVEGLGGRVDALFNCAGLSPTLPGLDVLRVNFLGTRHLTMRVAERIGSGGAIVSTSSNGGLRWRSRLPELTELLDTDSFEAGLAWIEPRIAGIANAYSFGKEALTVWTMRESARLIARGIRINCTSPGAVETPMLADIASKVPPAAIDAVTVPIGRRSPPEEQAWPLLFLNSDAASYINGVDLPVDGGFAATMALAG
ncbi:3-alpha-hydroxysteroid dehydrogenase [Nostoc sp. 3335mG]|nr:3-alpha-hydroxysteroid dehydrogenase [Nostoc sp. 3335mG]